MTTSQLPPCPLPDCEGGEHHYHDIDAYAVGEKHDCACEARIGYRCYGPHRPGLSEPIDLPANNRPEDEHIMPQSRKLWLDTSGLPVITTTPNGERNAARWGWTPAAAVALAATPQWQPIERDQIRAGMLILATMTYLDRVTTYMGVAHHTDEDGDWRTERDWRLTGCEDSTTYEVDPATIPDPDADLIELIGKAIHDADEPGFEWGEDGTEDAYRRMARAALAVIRESEATA